MATMNHNLKYKLEKTQNHALRIITGAAKSTPRVAMETLTKNLPMQTELDKRAVILTEKQPYQE